MTDLVRIVAVVAATVFAGALTRLFLDLRKEYKQSLAAREAEELSIEVTTPGGEVQHVIVNPEDELSIRRFLETVSDREPVAGLR
jgi:hypothetical protein